MAITITLDGIEVSGNPGMTILELAREAGVHIPTLCHDQHLAPYGACRVCIVENEQNGAMLASCVAPIAPGMVINTRSERVIESRKTIIKMMLASHPDNCMVCDKGNRCQLRQIASELGIGWVDFHRIPHPAEIQDVNPFIERDLSKCILCAKCIRADHELVVIGAIDYFNRGFSSKPATIGDSPLELSSCTFCGTCVALCPTGALQEKIKTYHGTTTKTVSTICGFCGCGCNIDLEVSEDRVVRSTPSQGRTPNGATLCVRGSYGFDYIANPQRLMQPLLRIDGELQPASWEEALTAVAENLEAVKSSHGAESIAVYGSSKCTNEDNYLFQKFARELIGTPNIDNGSRLFAASSHSALGRVLGYLSSTNPMEDIERANVILLVGSGVDIAAPVVSYAVKRAVKHKGAKLIVIDSHSSNMSILATLQLITKSGTSSTIVNAIMKEIIEQGMVEKDTMPGNMQSLADILAELKIEEIENATGVSSLEFTQVAQLLAQADQTAIIHGSECIDPVRCTIALANLALLIGSVGQSAGGFFDLQKANNGQGASDMGCLPEFLPGYRQVEGGPGLSVLEMIGEAKEGGIKAMYIMGENPVGELPDGSMVEEALSTLDFLVVQDLFLSETAKLANVVLPASAFAEKDGTFTNFERRIQRVRKAVEAPGMSLPDWEIIQNLANRMGSSWHYSSAQEIMNEISDSVDLYRGITYQNLEERGRFWPEPETGRLGTPRLYQGGFPEGMGQFVVDVSDEDEEIRGIPEKKTLYQFGSGVRSSMSARLSAMTQDV